MNPYANVKKALGYAVLLNVLAVIVFTLHSINWDHPVSNSGSSIAKNRSAVGPTLPDTTLPLSATRHNNITDEYSMFVGRYGKPDSILSTENDSPKPKVSTRIGRYEAAHLKVVFAPNGCVAAYEKAMEILADSGSYPELAKGEMRKMKRCIPPPNAGWTIVGYIDSSDSLPISAELARIRLEQRAEWAKVHQEYLKALKRPVDPKVADENLQRNRVESGSTLSEAAKLKHGCEVAHVLYDDKPISELTPKQLELLRFCVILGY